MFLYCTVYNYLGRYLVQVSQWYSSNTPMEVMVPYTQDLYIRERYKGSTDPTTVGSSSNNTPIEDLDLFFP